MTWNIWFRLKCKQILYCLFKEHTVQGTLFSFLWWTKWDRSPKEKDYIYIYVIHFILQPKLTHQCKATTVVQSVSQSVVSDSLQPHGLHHARLPCPSASPGACWNSCPLSQWCHPTISFSVVPFSSCLQSFPSSGSFPVSRLFTSGGLNIGWFC